MSDNPREEEIVRRTSDDIRHRFSEEGSGHDWWHIDRVRRMALHIARGEGADPFIVELAALLHDIADWKFHDGDLNAGPAAARAWLTECGADPDAVDHIAEIIARLSFKGAGVDTAMPTLEGRVVQDADRLDALGAIGIARTFAYGGHAGRLIYDPAIPPVLHTSAEAYRSSTAPSLNHFYEKLLLLRDRMHTPTARAIADERHAFLETFLTQFHREWNSESTSSAPV